MLTPGNDSEKSVEWIKLIKENDRSFLNEIYQGNYKKIELYILSNNGDKDDARDVFQESFLAAWRNVQMNRFAGTELSSFSGYLFTIARHKWLDVLRKRKRQETNPLSVVADEGEVEEINFENITYINKIKEMFNELGEQCKTILQLFYYEQKSMREIAAQFKITEASAKNNKYRCLQKLRDMVQKHKIN